MAITFEVIRAAHGAHGLRRAIRVLKAGDTARLVGWKRESATAAARAVRQATRGRRKPTFRFAGDPTNPLVTKVTRVT